MAIGDEGVILDDASIPFIKDYSQILKTRYTVSIQSRC